MWMCTHIRTTSSHFFTHNIAIQSAKLEPWHNLGAICDTYIHTYPHTYIYIYVHSHVYECVHTYAQHLHIFSPTTSQSNRPRQFRCYHIQQHQDYSWAAGEGGRIKKKIYIFQPFKYIRRMIFLIYFLLFWLRIRLLIYIFFFCAHLICSMVAMTKQMLHSRHRQLLWPVDLLASKPQLNESMCTRWGGTNKVAHGTRSIILMRPSRNWKTAWKSDAATSTLTCSSTRKPCTKIHHTQATADCLIWMSTDLRATGTSSLGLGKFAHSSMALRSTPSRRASTSAKSILCWFAKLVGIVRYLPNFCSTSCSNHWDTPPTMAKVTSRKLDGRGSEMAFATVVHNASLIRISSCEPSTKHTIRGKRSAISEVIGVVGHQLGLVHCSCDLWIAPLHLRSCQFSCLGV